MLGDLLRQTSIAIGREHAATIMKTMAIEPIYCRPNTSKPELAHKICTIKVPRQKLFHSPPGYRYLIL